MANTKFCTTKVDYDQDSTIKSVDILPSSLNDALQAMLRSACGGVNPVAGQTTKTVDCPVNQRSQNDADSWTYVYHSYSARIISNPHKKTYLRKYQAEKNVNPTSLTPGCKPCNVVPGVQRAVQTTTAWVETDNKNDTSTEKFPIAVAMDIKWLPQNGGPPYGWMKDRLSHVDKIGVQPVQVQLSTNTKTYSRNGSYNLRCVCVPY